MNRRDRLHGIVMYLERQEATSLALAKRFEVTKRTILRDIQTLCELGIPIYSKSGVGGGFGLEKGYKLPPLAFDKDEALAVMTAIRMLQNYRETPFAAKRFTVGDKILSGLPKDIADYVAALSKAIDVDVPQRRYTAPWLQALITYTAQNCWIEAEYHSQSARREVVLHPRRVFAANGFWYCDAYSQTHGEDRVFRVDRFKHVAVVSPPAQVACPPTGTADSTTRPAEPPNPATHPQGGGVRIVAKLTYRGMMQVETDPHVGENISAIDDDTWIVDFVCPQREVNWAIRLFFSLGLDAEVLAPPFVREEIRNRCEKLRRRYEA